MIVTMRHQTDCEVAAIATAAGVTWEQARDAVGWRELPLGAENPVFGNPENARLAIEKLGFKAINRTFTDMMTVATVGKTVVLVHDQTSPTLAQHWVVLADRAPNGVVGFHWGNGDIRFFRREHFLKLFTAGFPNAAFEVGEPIKPRGLLDRVRRWFSGLFK